MEHDSFPQVFNSKTISEKHQHYILYEGEITLRTKNSDYCSGEGTIYFSLEPKPETRFCFTSQHQVPHYLNNPEICYLVFKHANYASSFFPIVVTGCDPRRDTNSTTLSVLFSVKGVFTDYISIPAKNIQKVQFELCNFIKYQGDPIQDNDSPYLGRLFFEFDDWMIELHTKRKNAKELPLLLKEGEYELTHVGVVKKKDKRFFTDTEVESVISAFTYFCSFLTGTWVGLCMPEGYDEHGQKIWEQWTNPRVTAHINCDSWFPKHRRDPKSICDLFRQFWVLCNNEDMQDSLQILCSIYVESNTLITEARIMLVQSAFELLAWFMLTQNNRVIGETELDKQPAAKSLRMLFSSLQIPTCMPPVEDTSFLGNLIEVAAQDNLDSPECITRVRNRITHPKRKTNKEKQDKTSVFKYSNEIRWETSNLCLWYLEMCLLKIIGYHGYYSNRLRVRWSTSYDLVPWSKMRTLAGIVVDENN